MMGLPGSSDPDAYRCSPAAAMTLCGAYSTGETAVCQFQSWSILHPANLSITNNEKKRSIHFNPGPFGPACRSEATTGHSRSSGQIDGFTDRAGKLGQLRG